MSILPLERRIYQNHEGRDSIHLRYIFDEVLSNGETIRWKDDFYRGDSWIEFLDFYTDENGFQYVSGRFFMRPWNPDQKFTRITIEGAFEDVVIKQPMF